MSKESSRSFGKTVLGVILFCALVGLIIFGYNQYAKTYGDPEFREAIRNWKNVTAENEELKEQLEETQGDKEQLESDAKGVKNSFYYVCFAILAVLIILALSAQNRGDDLTREQLWPVAKEYAYKSYSMLPAAEYPNHPETMSWTRVYEDSVPIGRRADAGGTTIDPHYYIWGLVTKAPAWFKKVQPEYVLWVSIRSNNLNDVEFYPGFSIHDVKKQLEKNVKILNGIYGTTANETLSAIGEKALAKAAEQMTQEETS